MRDSSSRNMGLDLVRNLAIFLVVVQHIAFLGGLGNEGMGALHKLQARFIEAASQSCVDIFGMLSGYLGVTAVGWKWKRFGELWLQVWMTGLLVLGACALVGMAFPAAWGHQLPGVSDWLTAAFPLVRNEYWYFTGYACVFLLAPSINRYLFAEGREKLGLGVAIGVFLLVGGLSVFPGGAQMLSLAKGYSATWLVCLYVFGAALRCGEKRLGAIRPWAYFGLAGIGISLTAGQRLAMAGLPALKALFADEWTLSAYTSPTVTLTAAALLLGCAHLRPTASGSWFWRFSTVLAPCAFGVYLLHVQPFFFEQGFKGAFTLLDRVPDGVFGVAVVGLAGGLYVLFGLLEWGRRRVSSCVLRPFRVGEPRA